MDPPLLARTTRAVRTREVRTISRKDHVQAAVVSDDYLYGLIESFKTVLEGVRTGRHLTMAGLLDIVDIAYAMNSKTRRVKRSSIEAAIRGRGILTGHTPDSG